MKRFEELKAVFRRHDRFLISTHVNPDPDALSSQLVVALLLKSMGKRVDVLNEEPMPARFAFMPASGLVRHLPERHPQAAAAVIVDCGDIDRLGKVRRLVGPGTEIVNIDHHVTNTRFGRINWVDIKASSTAEIIHGIIKRGKWRLDRDMARLLYLGIMTDTGSFRYENTSARTHRIAAELLRHGIPVQEYFRQLYETIPLKDMKNFTRLMADFEPCLGGRAIVLEMTRAQIKGFSESFDLRDKIFKYLRAVDGVEVVAILSEVNAGATRINFRSTPAVDVARLAAQLGGGGHPRASGCEVALELGAARKKIMAELRRALA